MVEDDALIAMDIADLLVDEGMTIVGPAHSLVQARELVQGTDFDVALIDANLNGDPVDEIADILTSRNRPFAFCTGYGPEALPEQHRGVPILAKPFGRDDLLTVVGNLCRRTQTPA